ncbi:MAG: lysylphosphatidylglycerol synthase domain-containing protein [Cyanobacteria bacterium P01_A01_bin.84]
MIKRVLRWLILAGTLGFVTKTLIENWGKVGDRIEQINSAEWAILAIATGVTLLAHIWAGWVWTWILRDLNQKINTSRFIQIYLQTNIAKYIPGNIWHYYGRIIAAKNARISTSISTLSVLLEPLLMAAAALIIVLVSSQLSVTNTPIILRLGQLLGLIIVLLIIHPWFLNPAVVYLQRLKIKKKSYGGSISNSITSVRRYPAIPLLGEIGFILLRSTGFILTIYALAPLNLYQIPSLIGAFSFAWLVGLVVPGAPGGLGVFEAIAIFILKNSFFTASLPDDLIITTTLMYRLISILSESAGAGLSWLDEKILK